MRAREARVRARCAYALRADIDCFASRRSEIASGWAFRTCSSKLRTRRDGSSTPWCIAYGAARNRCCERCSGRLAATPLPCAAGECCLAALGWAVQARASDCCAPECGAVRALGTSENRLIHERGRIADDLTRDLLKIPSAPTSDAGRRRISEARQHVAKTSQKGNFSVEISRAARG